MKTSIEKAFTISNYKKGHLQQGYKYIPKLELRNKTEIL